MAFNWVCPFCNHASTIGGNNHSRDIHTFDCGNKEDGDLGFLTNVIVCPNPKCREYSIDAFLQAYRFPQGGGQRQFVGDKLMKWKLRPQSYAKPFPEYIPQQILGDYKEACLIRDLSPKASATLSRRALQGIIRDFWGIKKDRLFDEINALKEKVALPTWNAIDAVRSIGNIGAHMEKDIDLIVDVEPNEAELLIGLIEILLKDWYIARHDREQHLESIVAVAAAKKQIQKGSPA